MVIHSADMFFDSCICPQESVLWGNSPSRPDYFWAQSSQVSLILACAAPEMSQLTAKNTDYSIQKVIKQDTKHLGSQKHDSWQEEHEAPIAELTLLEFRKELIAVDMLKSAASRNITGCGGGGFFSDLMVCLNGSLRAQQKGQVHWCAESVASGSAQPQVLLGFVPRINQHKGKNCI